MKKVWIAVFALVVIVLVAYRIFGSLFIELEEEIASRWPPQDIRQVGETLAEVASNQADRLERSSNLVAFIPKAVVIDRLKTEIEQIEGVSSPTFAFSDGFIHVRAHVEATPAESSAELSGYELSANIELAIAPMVDAQGRTRFQIAMTRLTEIDVDGPNADSLPPSLSNLLEIQIRDRLAQVNAVFNSECAKDKESALLRVPSCIVPLPRSFLAAVDVKRALEGDPSTLTVSSAPVNLNYDIADVMVFAGADGIYAIAQLAIPELSALPSAEIIPPEPKARSLQEIGRWLKETSAANGLTTTQVGVSVSGSLIAPSITEIARRTDLRLVQAIDSPSETIAPTDVRLAKRPSFSCARDSCSREECRPPRCHTENGRNCGVGGLLGEAVCKLVTNTVCEAGIGANQLVCNTVQEVNKGTCDVFEELKTGGCNANRAFVDKALGRIGVLSGDYAVSGTYDASLSSLEVSPDLRRISASIEAGANATASGSLKFMPVDHGHLVACFAKWKEQFRVGVNLPIARREISASLEAVESSHDALELTYLIDEFEVSAKVSPSPFDAVFNQHPHLRVNCQLLSSIGDLAKLISIADPENDILPDDLNLAVTGVVRHKVSNQRFVVRVPPIHLDGSDIQLDPVKAGQQLVFLARPSS
jgi:hypothetical protein